MRPNEQPLRLVRFPVERILSSGLKSFLMGGEFAEGETEKTLKGTRSRPLQVYSPAELSSPPVAATGTIVVVREKLTLIVESAGSSETFGLSPRVIDAVFGGWVAGSPLQQSRLGTAELAQVLQHRDHCPWVKTSPVHQCHAVTVGFALFFTRVTLLLREIVNAGDEASCISYL